MTTQAQTAGTKLFNRLSGAEKIQFLASRTEGYAQGLGYQYANELGMSPEDSVAAVTRVQELCDAEFEVIAAASFGCN